MYVCVRVRALLAAGALCEAVVNGEYSEVSL